MDSNIGRKSLKDPTFYSTRKGSLNTLLESTFQLYLDASDHCFLLQQHKIFLGVMIKK